MFFKYHKLMKKNEIDLLHCNDKEKIIDTIKLIAERPILSFFSYQVRGFVDDIEIFYEDAEWIEKYDAVLCYFYEWRYLGLICRILEWSVGLPCIIYFAIFRFFICLLRWRKYYRDSSLIILKLC